MEKEIATHSSVLAWRIPGTGKPGGLPFMGLHRVRHDLSDLAAYTHKHITKKQNLKRSDVSIMISTIIGLRKSSSR